MVGAVTNVSKSDEYETPGVFTGSLVKTKVPADGLFIYEDKFYYSAGSVDLGFGGLDELGGLDPYIKERLGMDEVLKDFDFDLFK